MKALMATTVEPSPSAAIHAHPAGSKPRCSDPVARPTTQRVAAAPVVIRAPSRKGSMRPTTRSEMRM